MIFQTNFKDSSTIVMEGIREFHNEIQLYLLMIVTVVAWLLAAVIYIFGFKNRFVFSKIFKESSKLNIFITYFLEVVSFLGLSADKRVNVLQIRRNVLLTKNVTHGVILEIIWTLIPVTILLLMISPSISLLYSVDNIEHPEITIKIIGQQWYWVYEYEINKEICNKLFEQNKQIINFFSMDSYMTVEQDLGIGQLRLLEVDCPMILPINTRIRLLITSADVLHSWAVPSAGIKMDAVPGRLNQVSLILQREGNFYGQCSELCGVNHGFMPIAFKAMRVEMYQDWLVTKAILINGIENLKKNIYVELGLEKKEQEDKKEVEVEEIALIKLDSKAPRMSWIDTFWLASLTKYVVK